MTTYLITGISGFTGYHIAKRLAQEKDAKLIGIDIAEFQYSDLKEHVEFHKGDIRDQELVEKISQGVDVIIHSAAALPLYSEKEIFSTNVDGTRTLLQAALTNKVKRFIHISSTAVYGIPKVHPVPEDAPLEGVGPYGKSKIMAERLCEEYRNKGLVVTILRPKTFAGPYRLGVFTVLCDWVYSKKNVPLIGSGKNHYQLLHVYDLVEAIYQVAHAPKEKVNDVFNVGSTEFMTMKEDLQALLDHAGFGKKVVPIPKWLVVPPLIVMDKLHLSPLYEWVYETADQDHYVSVDKLKEAIGFEPKYSSAQVWIDTYDWYAQNAGNIKKSGIDHRSGWKQGLLGAAKWFF